MTTQIDRSDYTDLMDLINSSKGGPSKKELEELDQMISLRVVLKEIMSKGSKADSLRKKNDDRIHKFLKKFNSPGVYNASAGVDAVPAQGRGKWDLEYVERMLSPEQFKEAFTSGGRVVRLKSYVINAPEQDE